jgi:hypothetical protein
LGKTEQRHNMMKNYLWQVLPELDLASRSEVGDAVHDWVQWHNFDSPHGLDNLSDRRLGQEKEVPLYFVSEVRLPQGLNR